MLIRGTISPLDPDTDKAEGTGSTVNIMRLTRAATRALLQQSYVLHQVMRFNRPQPVFRKAK